MSISKLLGTRYDYKIFIGGSCHDNVGTDHGNDRHGEELSRRIHEVLEEKFDKCFLAENDIICGESLTECLPKALDRSQIFVIMLTTETEHCKVCKLERDLIMKHCIEECQYRGVVVKEKGIKLSSVFERFIQVDICESNFKECLHAAVTEKWRQFEAVTASCESRLDYIKCPNSGCPVTHHSSESHNCRHREVICSYVGCGSKYKAKFEQAHGSECLYASVNCPNEKCSKTVVRNDLETHLDSCKYHVIACTNALCSAQFCRKNARRHHEKCMYTASIRCPWCKQYFCGFDYRNHKSVCPVKIKNKQKMIEKRRRAHKPFMFSMLGK